MKQAEIAAAGGADYYGRLSAAAGSVAATISEVAAGHTALILLAEAELHRPNADQAEIIRRYHAAARRSTEFGVEAMSAAIKSAVNGLGAPSISALTAMVSAGGPPASPPLIDALDNSPADYGHRGENVEPARAADDAGVAPNTRGEYQEGSAPRPGESGESDDASSVSKDITDFGHRGEYAVSPPPTAPSRQASPPLGGGVPSMSGLGGGGGMGTGGGPSMPGGLGSGSLSGLSSNPLTGGLGGMPGAAGGLPAGGGVSASAGSGSPAAAFSRGLSTGAGIGGGMPTLPPTAPASPSPALSPGGSAAPAAAAGGGVAPAAAQPGTVAPAAPAASAGAGMGSAAPMMLPPGSMGPPAGAVPPPAAASMPAGTIGGGSNAPSSAAPPSTGGGGATLIPASVVAAGQTAAARERRESADAAAVKELAWKLQHAAQVVGYPTEWAVGVFRSPSGTETVITSNDGASFIPAGVFVPRSVRVLAADPLVDDHFRQLWFGWADPARVLIEYAHLRADMGWRLVAAATTGPVSVLRDAGVEHPPSCTRQSSPLLQPGQHVAAPTMDAMHVHRLSVMWPDVYPRLLRVMDAEPIFQDRIVGAVSALLMNSATTQAVAVDGGIPDPIRLIWMTRGGDRDPSPQQWADYDESAKNFNTVTSIFRPGFVGGADPSDNIAELSSAPSAI